MVEMYKSAKAIQSKLRQAKYVYKQISKFKNRIFVNNGLDEETGASPLLVHLSSFLAHTRSVLQYAHKEAKEAGKLAEYESRVAEKPIFRFFKQLRDSDIHKYTIGSHTTITTAVNIVSSDIESNVLTTGWVGFMVEDLSDLDTPKNNDDHLNITTTLSKHIDVTDVLIRQLEVEGKQNLVDAANNGKELYEQQEFDGEIDLFELCEKYLVELENFVSIGVIDGFIS